MTKIRPWVLSLKQTFDLADSTTVAKSTHILHNTMKPSTRQTVVEHTAWARGTREPELKDQDQGDRTRGPEPSSRSRRQDRDPDKNRNRAPRLEDNQVQRG